MKNVEQKVAIVTGASSGIGESIAKRLDSDGFQIVVNYSSNAVVTSAVVQRVD